MAAEITKALVKGNTSLLQRACLDMRKSDMTAHARKRLCAAASQPQAGVHSPSRSTSSPQQRAGSSVQSTSLYPVPHCRGHNSAPRQKVRCQAANKPRSKGQQSGQPGKDKKQEQKGSQNSSNSAGSTATSFYPPRADSPYSRRQAEAQSASSNGTGGGAAEEAGRSDWGDWEAPTDDWDDLGKSVPASGLSAPQKRAIHSRKQRGGKAPRDEFMRPIIDTQGVLQRITTNVDETERNILEEFEDNRSESRAAVTYAGMLLAVPLLVGFATSVTLANPFLEVAQGFNHEVFALTDREKVEGAKHVHTHELRLRMDAAIGRSPPISEWEMQIELKREAHHLVEEFEHHKRTALLHLLSDGAAFSTFFLMLGFMREARASLFSTIGRIFGGLSDTAKAFLIIASTDILLGYHSEEGWTAAIRMLTRHYGYDVENGPIYVFVAVVPVTLDALFKYWIFKGLNRQSPAAAVTLRNMDRH